MSELNDSGKILLGFEVGSGKAVFLSIHHLAAFGMTQLSGKTTMLEALISRSALRAIAFKTKRGEAGFTSYHTVMPYYKPRADWQFVEGLVNVALNERVKYEPGMRYAIMKVCKGRKDLKEIRQATQNLAESTKKDFMKSVYEKLVAYLDIVVPELAKWPFSDKLELEDGVNVMDLANMRLETQHLVIASTIEYAFSHLDHVVVIVPEAWETLPQSRMTPVKWVAQQFIRKGATIGNYLWLDSQDIGGIDKAPLRQCDNWLMGRMKEAHEVERILKQLLGLKVPKEEIQTLALGHFYAAIGNDVKKVYVLPNGVPTEEGKKVALGLLSPEEIRERYLKSRVSEDDLMYREKYEQLLKQVEDIRLKAFEEGQASLSKDVIEDNKFLSEERQRLEQKVENLQKLNSEATELIEKLQSDRKELETLAKFKNLLKELMPSQKIPSAHSSPNHLSLQHKELTVTIEDAGPKETKMTTEKAAGQLLFCAIEFQKQDKQTFTSAEIQKEAIERGWKIGNRELGGTLMYLTREGFLIQEGSNYHLPAKVKVNVVKL